MRIFFRKLHRWLGLLMAIQIIAWMASGLYFSLVPIAEIRGEHLTRPMPGPDKGQLAELVNPGQLPDLLDQHFAGDWTLHSLELVNLNGQARWRIEAESGGQMHSRLVSSTAAGIEPSLTAEQASIRARDWLREASRPVSIEWIENLSQSPEIRGRDLPVWKVAFEQPVAVNLYIHPWTGELLARRTQQWRIFDFLWMLHIMDFDTRENFNHPLLQISAALGLVIALSGVFFWALTTRLFRRRSRRVDPVAG
jgi:uncharacterized iron-regulated membrane protein